MRRKTLILTVGGSLAAAAIVGTAIGAGAAEVASEGLGPAPAATTSRTDPTGTPGTRPTDDPTGTPGTGPTSTPPAAGSVTSERAVEIALAIAGGGRLDDVEREWEHGRTVWSVKVVDGGWEVRVDVDAATGEVVRTEQDDDRDDARRGRDDG